MFMLFLEFFGGVYMRGLVIGVDLGGTKMHAAAVDENGTLLHDEREKTLPDNCAPSASACPAV
jgi:predicted NBD/HSP70 family sugar kinase